MMEFSAPTTASHPRNSVTSLGAPTAPEEEEDRDVKRRKMIQQQQRDVPDASMMDTTMSTAHGGTYPAQEDMTTTTMEMDSHNHMAVPSSAPGYYAHPSTCNMFNGNALSDEELVYQVLQSGAQTYAEVVQFCVRHGIPVSRVLQMDLMGRLTYLRAA